MCVCVGVSCRLEKQRKNQQRTKGEKKNSRPNKKKIHRGKQKHEAERRGGFDNETKLSDGPREKVEKGGGERSKDANLSH